jgi:hypothetical protein
MGRRPLVILAAVAIALPLAGAIAPASGLTSRGVSTPLGAGMHASRHPHQHGLSSSEAVATRHRPSITVARRVPQPPAPPVQAHATTRHSKHPAGKHPKKAAGKHPKKHPKPTPSGGGVSRKGPVHKSGPVHKKVAVHKQGPVYKQGPSHTMLPLWVMFR